MMYYKSRVTYTDRRGRWPGRRSWIGSVEQRERTEATHDVPLNVGTDEQAVTSRRRRDNPDRRRRASEIRETRPSVARTCALWRGCGGQG